MSIVPLVQNFSLSGEINSKFAVDWSVDNKIALCTAKAIYIMNSRCSPLETGFPTALHKQAIPVSQKPMHLNKLTVPCNPYKHIQTNEDRENLFNVLMDHTLHPSPAERSEAFRSFRCCRWSPLGAASTGKCLLAALTMDHRLSLYEEDRGGEWRCLCDLTELIKEQMIAPKKDSRNGGGSSKKKKKSSTRSDSDEDFELDVKMEKNISKSFNYEKLLEDVYKYAAMEITWTGMFGAAPAGINDKCYEFCFLIVAMKSGHIQFWKVSPSEGRLISLVHEWDTGLGVIKTLSWQQTSSTAGFLMCGSLKGVLGFVPVSILIASAHEPIVVVKSMCKIWDEDFIAVDHVSVLKIALRKYVIIAAKLHVFVGCEIHLTEDSIIIRNVGHSFGMHRLPITGMAVLDRRSIPQHKVLISTMEGKLIEMKVSLLDEEIKFQHDAIHMDIDLQNHMIQGLAVSANGLLCGILLSTSVYFDHLEKKEPLQFAMFVTKPYEEIYKKLRSVLKPQFSFMPSSSGNTIANYADYLECLRINMASGTPLPQWLMDLIESDPSTYENYSAMELYLLRFLLNAYVSGLAITAPKEKTEFEVRLYMAEAVIMKNYISRVLRQCQDHLLTPGQSQSLLLMADWLLKEFQMPVEGLYSALGCDTPQGPGSLPPRETCDICKGEVRLENMRVGRCDRNHEFARCCHSLLLCDVVPYLKCSSCNSVALRDLWNGNLTCTFCGMNMS